MISIPGIEFFTTLIIYILIFLIITLSYNLAYGYSGIPDFGRAMAAGAGGFLCGYLPGSLMAYILGIRGDYLSNVYVIVDKVNMTLESSPPLSIGLLILTLILGACAGGLIGLLASLPILRGELGVPIPDPFRWLMHYRILGLSPGIIRSFGLIATAGIVLLIIAYYCISVGRSPLGRVLKAIRDDEVAAATLGRDIRKIYVKVMVVSYAITGIAGALYAFYQGYVVGLHFDKIDWTFWPIAMVILGGLANNKGTFLGTITFIVLRRLITFYKSDLEFILPFSPIWLESLLLGAVLILLLIYRPRGLLPERPEIPLSREEIEKIRRKVGA